MHPGMRQGEPGRADAGLIIGKHVYVNDAVVIGTIATLHRTSHVAFYLLCDVKALQGAQVGTDQTGSIQESVLTAKAHRISLYERGCAQDSAYALTYEAQCCGQLPVTVSQIASQRKV